MFNRVSFAIWICIRYTTRPARHWESASAKFLLFDRHFQRIRKRFYVFMTRLRIEFRRATHKIRPFNVDVLLWQRDAHKYYGFCMGWIGERPEEFYSLGIKHIFSDSKLNSGNVYAKWYTYINDIHSIFFYFLQGGINHVRKEIVTSTAGIKCLLIHYILGKLSNAQICLYLNNIYSHDRYNLIKDTITLTRLKRTLKRKRVSMSVRSVYPWPKFDVENLVTPGSAERSISKKIHFVEEKSGIYFLMIRNDYRKMKSCLMLLRYSVNLRMIITEKCRYQGRNINFMSR